MKRLTSFLCAGMLAMAAVGCEVDDDADGLDTPVNNVQVPDGSAGDADDALDLSEEGEQVDVDVDLGAGPAAAAPAEDADSLPELRQERRQERRERIGEALENVDVQVDDEDVDVQLDDANVDVDAE